MDLDPDSILRHVHSGAVGWKRVGPRGWFLVDAADVEKLVVKSHKGADAAGGAAGGNEDEYLEAG